MVLNIDVSGVDKDLEKHLLYWEAILMQLSYNTMKGPHRAAKRLASWKDRTGRARENIFFDTVMDGTQLNYLLIGGMYYSPYLELCNEKVYAILFPVVATEVVRRMREACKETFKVLFEADESKGPLVTD